MAIGSNLPFSEWGQVVTDPRLVAAIVDRVTFNGHIIETGSESFRLATTRAKRVRGEGQLTQRTFCIKALALARSNSVGSKGPSAHSTIRSCSACSGSVTASRNSV